MMRRGRGGIGRHTGLKILRFQRHAGSIPAVPTRGTDLKSPAGPSHLCDFFNIRSQFKKIDTGFRVSLSFHMWGQFLVVVTNDAATGCRCHSS